jgi:alpha-amylase/alpha-mannosidase (GH57 family)
MNAVTVSEALRLMAPQPLDHIFPGSWIDANFDVWIGAEEDNQAWTQLLRARQTFDAASGAVPEEKRRMAMEELLIAEGSDWCWWYGPEHDSANRPEFDQLYRSHLANVYRFLNLAPPEELSHPILRMLEPEVQVPPSGPISPRIDGEVTSYFEWIGAGAYRVDERSGSMHGKKFVIREVLYGSDGGNFFVRMDFHAGYQEDRAGMEARLTLQSLKDSNTSHVTVDFTDGGRLVETLNPPAEAALRRVLEVRIPLAAVAVEKGGGLRFQLSLWQGGLPIDAVPQQGWIEMMTTDPVEMAE